MIMYLVENNRIGLIQYTHADDQDMFLCWQDIGTQKGYNGIFSMTFDEFSKADISQFSFWVTIVDKSTSARVGTLRLGLDDDCPDLAIWIYPKYRNMGYSKESFRLALLYLFEKYQYQQLSAGCYWDNEASQRMLKSIGFKRYSNGDCEEINVFTGKPTVQQEFRITKAQIV